MNDFETVRSHLVGSTIAREALDRIEAEVGRLKMENSQLVEKLGYALDRLNTTEVPPLRAEVERLQAEKNAVERNWLQQETELQELRGIAEDQHAALERCLEKATKHGDDDIEAIARAALAKEDR